MITIMNMRRSRPSQPYDYRCDRANKILGNHPGQGMPRQESIAAFDKYLSLHLSDENMNLVRNEMNRIYQLHQQYGQLRLFCWCTPLPCHTELIKTRLEKVI